MSSNDIGSPALASNGDMSKSIGIVVIGRNEGPRLRRCFESLSQHTAKIAYVDSGSTDDSVATARALGIAVVELDMKIPFTAARARNSGFARLLEIDPQLHYVQFVDGDCEVNPGWIGTAYKFLETHLDVVVVSGRLRERFPQASVYNMLCDIEWSAPAGEAKMCGGVAMMRVAALNQVGGFDASLICGEEPELCSRLRARGGRIWRLSDEMGWHDANMMRFGQWWRRTVRSGFSDAQAVVVDGAPPERRGVRASQRAWFWGFLFPLCSVLLTLFWQPIGLLLLLAYPLQISRLALRGSRSLRDNWLHALFLVIGKFPEVQGQVKYWRQRLSGQHGQIIEHK